MNRLLLILILSVSCTVLSGQNISGIRNAHAANAAPRYTDMDLIAKYNRAIGADSCLQEAWRLMESGSDNGDILIQTFGNALAGRHFLHLGPEDSALLYMNRAIMLAGRHDSTSHNFAYEWIMSEVYNNLGLFYLNRQLDYYKASQYLLEALKYTDSSNDRLPLLLANLTLVHAFRNDTTGMEFALRLKEYSDRTGEARFVSDYCMALMSHTCSRPEQAEMYINKALEELSLEEKPAPRNYIMAYNLQAKIMLSLKKVDLAIESLDKARSIKHRLDDCDISDTYLTIGHYLVDRGKLTEALDILIEGVHLSDSTDAYVHLGEMYSLISEIYERQHDWKNALRYERLMNEEERRTFDRRKEYDLTEIKAKYKLEQYENTIKEKEIEVLRRDRFLIILASVMIIIVASSLIAWHTMRRKNRYYEKIVQQYTRNATLNKRIRELEDQNRKYTSSTLSDTKGDDLYGRLCRMMNEERVYHDQNLSIDKLASMLETNRTYLSRIINERTGMNFSQYINKHRIDEAVSTIMDSHGECLLKSLAFELGFKTTSSFYKAFSKETGMPPASFRDKCAEGR